MLPVCFYHTLSTTTHTEVYTLDYVYICVFMHITFALSLHVLSVCAVLYLSVP